MSKFIVLTIIILLIVFLAFKWNNYRTRLAYVFIVLGIGFLLLTGFVVFSGSQINVSTIEGISSATSTYLSWLGNAGSNIIKISSYALNQEWKGEEILNETRIG